MTALKEKLKILLYLCLFTCSQQVFSQDEGALSDEIWKELTEDLDYGEAKDQEPKAEELKTSSNFLKSEAFKIIVITISIIGLTLLLTKILGLNSSKKKIKIKDKSFNVVTDEDEDLLTSDLDSLLEDLIRKQQFRFASRILYLQSLRLLNESNFIHWEKEKTNFDYINELSTQKFQADFRELTLIFELIWYGESNIDQQEFGIIQNRFTHFKTLIHNE